jgi:hypothetical protein
VAGELKRRIETIANFLDDLDTSDGDGDISDAVKDLRALVPDEKAIAKYTEESKAWVANNMKLSGRNNHHVGLVAQAKTTRSTLEIQITACKETIEKEAAIGPGLDQNDVATRDGFLTRKAELDASASTLRLMKVRADDIEKAKIEAGKAAEQEKAAKEKIAEAVEAQRKAVQDAEEELARRSKEFLPYGNLRILDEGKRFDLLWAKDGDTRVSRSTLSGGEQCLFDAAVARSLAPTAAVVIEAAEIDDATLTAFLTDTAEATYQLIVLTCHEPPEVPGGWKHIKMGE